MYKSIQNNNIIIIRMLSPDLIYISFLLFSVCGIFMVFDFHSSSGGGNAYMCIYISKIKKLHHSFAHMIQLSSMIFDLFCFTKNRNKCIIDRYSPRKKKLSHTGAQQLTKKNVTKHQRFIRVQSDIKGIDYRAWGRVCKCPFSSPNEIRLGRSNLAPILLCPIFLQPTESKFYTLHAIPNYYFF